MISERYNTLKVEFTEGKFSDYLDSVYSILKSNRLLSLGTIGIKVNSPHLCSAYYVYDEEFNLYIWTDTNSVHCKDIEKNNLVAINIADTSQKWGSNLRGLQIRGRAYPLSLLQMLKPAKLYMTRFPLVKKFIKNPKEFNTKFDSKLYKIEIEWIKLFDEAKFRKEVWKELAIKRK